MLRSSLFWKLYAGYVALILLALATVGVLASRHAEQEALRETQDSLRSTALLLRDLSGPGFLREGASSDPGLEQRIRRLGEEIGSRLTLIRLDGRVIADSMEDPDQMDNHGSRPEILSALSHGSGTATRFSDTLGVPMLYLALPVTREGEVIGFVRTALPLPFVRERLARLRSALLGGTGLSAALALALGFFLARRFIRPLDQMSAAAQRIAEGDYSQVIPVSRADEMGRLARALRRMSESSRERLETINADRKKLLAILGGMVEGVVAVDQEECVLHMNAVAGEILDASPEESLGQPLWKVTRAAEVSQFLTSVLRGQALREREFQIRNRGGKRSIRISASPLRNAGENPSGAVLVLHDVSELNRLERVRQDFVASVSHELKTPIAAVRALAETLAGETDMDPETRNKFLGKIRNQSLRLSSLVSELLTLARLESGQERERYSRVDLRDPVRAAVEALIPGAREKRISLEVTTPEDPVLVLGDREDLQQLTSNLVDNAVKYTQEGGDVSIRLGTGDSSAILEVRDTGAGIEPAYQERIFERFYRVDRARSKALGGTGLGLAIVKHIVLSHRGTVSVESRPGCGSTFRVTVPLASGES